MKKQTLALTRGAMIGALYVLLTYISSILGLASGNVQLRLSEGLIVLAAFFPEAIAGLSLGCFLSNLLFGVVPWDLLLGTLATVLGAVGAYLLRNCKWKFLIPLPNIVANTLLVPLVIVLAAGGDTAFATYPLFMLTVFLGELLSSGVLGYLVLITVKKRSLLE